MCCCYHLYPPPQLSYSLFVFFLWLVRPLSRDARNSLRLFLMVPLFLLSSRTSPLLPLLLLYPLCTTTTTTTTTNCSHNMPLFCGPLLHYILQSRLQKLSGDIQSRTVGGLERMDEVVRCWVYRKNRFQVYNIVYDSRHCNRFFCIDWYSVAPGSAIDRKNGGPNRVHLVGYWHESGDGRNVLFIWISFRMER